MDDQPTPRPHKAPDPSRCYERSRPEDESGQGRLDNDVATPANTPDRIDHAAKNRQANRQLNAEDVVNEREESAPIALPTSPQPDHSMNEEEPDGWDMAPTDIHNPRHKRHPRTEGRGGTP